MRKKTFEEMFVEADSKQRDMIIMSALLCLMHKEKRELFRTDWVKP